jgi:hypothetical protein
MTNLEIFLISAVGLGIGNFIGHRLASYDLVGRIGWAAVGAMPGAAFMVGQPSAMAAMLFAIPVLLVRRHRLAVRASE